jgi:hypothetical protein
MQQEPFENHPMWEMVTQTLALAEDLDPSRSPVENDASQRIAFVASYTRSFRVVPPEYLTEQMLQALFADWEHPTDELPVHGKRRPRSQRDPSRRERCSPPRGVAHTDSQGRCGGQSGGCV